MASDPESEASTEQKTTSATPTGWLKIAVLTAGSALVGGMAAAWWYRKTLAKLRETGENDKNPHFGIPGDPPSDGSEDDL
jgi:hypothetical protein